MDNNSENYRRNSNNEKEKRNKKSNRNKKPSKLRLKLNKFKSKHPVAAKRIKIGIIVFAFLCIIGLGCLVGTIYGLIGDDLKIDEELLVVGSENSTVYDKDGNLIATLSGGTKRKSITLEEMSEYLPKAYVAIEDERFYQHNGVDIKRTIYATLTYVFHRGSSSFGASTITQQVVKNITNDKDKTSIAGALRKIKEISKARQVEEYLSKDQILELYLNLIFVGGDDINGVELGSIYYFNKSAKDLDIAECAFMAGINNSPNSYKPFATYEGDSDQEAKKQKMTEKINKRTKAVLSKMLELKYISQDQYDQAVAEVESGLHFEKGEASSASTDVSYHTEAAIEQILDQILAENEDMNRDTAELYLYSSGLKIYTTQDSNLQAILEKNISSKDYITKQTYQTKDEDGNNVNETQYSIPSMVIMDHTTGQVVACATATGNSDNRSATTKLGYLNYPTSIKKQTGSCMKPIAVIAPGLQSGKITGATVFDDCETTFGSGSLAWTPKDYDYYRGLINMRTAVGVSANIPHAKALSIIGVDTAVEFCESVGLPNFKAEGLSLALGGLNEGVSPYQMCAAYAAIANDGTYITPTFYTKVTDFSGNIIYEAKQESKEVMSKENAYLEKEILTEPVTSGTATYCKLPGIETAAKTGTTNDDYDRWLCGFTPYYTAVCWYGYEYNATVKYGNGNPAGRIWDAVMTEIHKPLENKNFEKPEGVITASVCRLSGNLAGDACGANVYTEYFTKDNIPTDKCTSHTGVNICNDSGLLATEFCPNVTQVYSTLPVYEQNASWNSKHTTSTATIPTEYCTLHTQGNEEANMTYEDLINADNTVTPTESTTTTTVVQPSKPKETEIVVNTTVPSGGSSGGETNPTAPESNNNDNQSQNTTETPEVPVDVNNGVEIN